MSTIQLSERDFVSLKIAGIVAERCTWKTFKQTLTRWVDLRMCMEFPWIRATPT